jgi:thiol-disulfide isomerase/thioredoxin
MYFSNPLYNDWDAKEKATKDYDLDQYLMYLDTLKHKIDYLYKGFVTEVNPDKEVQVWAKTYIEQDYYDALSWYPSDHLRANKLKRNEWSVPDSYYDTLLSRLPIKKEMFISGYALSGFINRFHYDYSRRHIWNEEQNQQYKTPEGYTVAPTEISDSLTIYGIIKYTPDTLLRQMILTEFFRQQFDKSKLTLFEKYKHIVDKYIKEPFLIEPLVESYYQIKDRIENPEVATNAYLKKLETSSANQIIDSILNKNEGKVVYLDCWATWCSPCKAEMPRSKKLMEEMKDRNVAFVFLCIDSEEKLWKANLAEFQIGGQHYYLNKEQSTDLRKAFEVSGIPHYFLINKEGVIVEKGSHLRPNGVKEKIENLLEE